MGWGDAGLCMRGRGRGRRDFSSICLSPLSYDLVWCGLQPIIISFIAIPIRRLCFPCFLPLLSLFPIYDSAGTFLSG